MKAWIKKGKIYFDIDGWALVKKVSKRKHQSPKTIVNRALWAMIRREKKDEGLQLRREAYVSVRS